MRVRSQMVAQALEAFEAVGVDRRELMAEVGLDQATVADRHSYIDWGTFVALLDAGWARLDRDVERLRQVGRAIAHAPSYETLPRLARTVVSVKRLYYFGARWGSLASLSQVSFEQRPVSDRRYGFRCLIAEPHLPSLALQHLVEGVIVEMPTLIGLPPAAVVSSVATGRSLDLVIELPPAPSLRARLGRAVRAALDLGAELDLLETERQVLSDALAETERGAAENRELLERLPDYVLIHRDGVILWMNRANVRSLGYERSEQLAGHKLLDLVEPSSREVVRARMAQPVTDESAEVSEVRLMGRDGRVIVVEISPAQKVTFEGKPARLIVGRDVSERVRMQEQLRIADRMASIGLLAAGVAHEVNNPLAYVLNNIEIARKAIAPLGERAGPSRDALEVALEGVDRIRTIVRDLLALSRVDDAEIGPVDVSSVVASTLALAGKTISERATLSLEQHPVPPAVGSAARLGQVLLNLVTNALESMHAASPEGNLLRVVVRPSSEGGAVIEVSDNGVGIPAEHQAKIFDPFFTTKEPGKGTGIGLAISQRLVAEMGGQLSFESTPLRGSTFRVTLAPWELAAVSARPG